MANSKARETAGKLYVVATPIGNLGDITHRALEVLGKVDAVLAEDTRHSRQLLAHYDITTPLHPFHDHNELRLAPHWLDALLQGKSLALISDAGTPLIADPGLPLVRLLREQGIAVHPIPGANAMIAVLSAAGMPCHRFCFEGFLSAKAQARQQQLQALRVEQRTMVFYESPRRLLPMLNDLALVLGEQRQVCVAKELTKLFESFFLGTVVEILTTLSQQQAGLRGEFVVVVAGHQPSLEGSHDDQIIMTMTALLQEQLPLKQAAGIAARLCGCSKRQAYQLGLGLLP